MTKEKLNKIALLGKALYSFKQGAVYHLSDKETEDFYIFETRIATLTSFLCH